MGRESNRLDAELVTRQLVRSRSHAADLIGRHRVRVNGQIAAKSSQRTLPADQLEVDEDRYVSRAANKLTGALDHFARTTGLAVPARVLDAGASTGGFTQVLTERGAVRVFAIDVGHDQLADSVRQDPRVVVHEGTNLRDLTLEHVAGEPVQLVVADVSFISLTLLLAPMLDVLTENGQALLMVKPQFEVGRALLGGGGVVRDPELHAQAVRSVLDAAARLGWQCLGEVPSELPGPSGNKEFFVLLSRLTGSRG